MSDVLRYLDCGCAIMKDGRRSWCPTCADDGAKPTRHVTVRRTGDLVYARLDGEAGKPLSELDGTGMIVAHVIQREGAPLMSGDLVEIVRVVADE